jgi:hypothetical protein
MRRALTALALSLAIAATPEAFAICQVICAPSSAHDDITSHQHSGDTSHHTTAPVADVAVYAAANHDGCHRTAASPLTAGAPARTASAAILTSVVAILPPQPLVGMHTDSGAANPPALVPLRIALRI